MEAGLRTIEANIDFSGPPSPPSVSWPNRRMPTIAPFKLGDRDGPLLARVSVWRGSSSNRLRNEAVLAAYTLGAMFLECRAVGPKRREAEVGVRVGIKMAVAWYGPKVVLRALKAECDPCLEVCTSLLRNIQDFGPYIRFLNQKNYTQHLGNTKWFLLKPVSAAESAGQAGRAASRSRHRSWDRAPGKAAASCTGR